MKKIILLFISISMLLNLYSCKCIEKADSIKYDAVKIINLSKTSATLDNKEIEEFDYTWNVDPSTVHDEVKDAPAEYYTGTKPDDNLGVYIDHELYYYPKLDTSKFVLVNYDGEREYAYYYEDGVNNDYIFATLPCFERNNEVITSMMFSKEEAANNKVLHINEPGTYVLQGEWNGQIKIDLGDEDETFTDETKKVTIILNGVDIVCSVAPALLFENAYEVDNAWEQREEKLNEIDTSNAGVNVIITDDTENNISGKNIYRMLKTKYKDENSTDVIKVQKKLRKMDAPFYSYVSMNINGEENNTGVLNVTSSFEGLDSELHLTINGGNITINSEDDGINVNEDNVSIVSFLGGNITLNAANGAEGDGVDSNGYVVIDGSNLYINNVRVPDNSVDSEDGILYKSGSIYIDNVLEELEYGEYKEIGGGFNGNGFGPMMNFEDLDISEIKQKILELDDDATLQDIMDIIGMNNRPFEDAGGERDLPNGEIPNMQNEPPKNDMPSFQGEPEDRDFMPNDREIDITKRDLLPPLNKLLLV